MIYLCPHGETYCRGEPNRAPPVPGCASGEYVFCPHGYDVRKATREGRPVCPWCRGITRGERNRLVPGYRPGPRIDAD